MALYCYALSTTVSSPSEKVKGARWIEKYDTYIQYYPVICTIIKYLNSHKLNTDINSYINHCNINPAYFLLPLRKPEIQRKI